MEFDQSEASSAVFGWPGLENDRWSQLADHGILIEMFIVLERSHSHCLIDHVLVTASANTLCKVVGYVHDVTEQGWTDCAVHYVFIVIGSIWRHYLLTRCVLKVEFWHCPSVHSSIYSTEEIIYWSKFDLMHLHSYCFNDTTETVCHQLYLCHHRCSVGLGFSSCGRKKMGKQVADAHSFRL